MKRIRLPMPGESKHRRTTEGKRNNTANERAEPRWPEMPATSQWTGESNPPRSSRRLQPDSDSPGRDLGLWLRGRFNRWRRLVRRVAGGAFRRQLCGGGGNVKSIGIVQ